MKVRIGNLEVTDVTPDELDELVKRYGNANPATAQNEAKATPPTPPSAAAQSSIASLPSGAADTVLLKKLVEAGSTGMTTNDIGTILGKRGKAAKNALDNWGKRIGLSSGENADSFEFARVGTKRGWRIKPSLLDVAKHLMTQH